MKLTTPRFFQSSNSLFYTSNGSNTESLSFIINHSNSARFFLNIVIRKRCLLAENHRLIKLIINLPRKFSTYRRLHNTILPDARGEGTGNSVCPIAPNSWLYFSSSVVIRIWLLLFYNRVLNSKTRLRLLNSRNKRTFGSRIKMTHVRKMR